MMKPDVIDGDVFCKMGYRGLASIRIYIPPSNTGRHGAIAVFGNIRHGEVGTTNIEPERTADTND